MNEAEFRTYLNAILAGVLLEGITLEPLGEVYSNDDTEWGVLLQDGVSGSEVALGYGNITGPTIAKLPRRGFAAWYDKRVDVGDRDIPPDVDVIHLYQGTDPFKCINVTFTFFLAERIARAHECLADEAYCEEVEGRNDR